MSGVGFTHFSFLCDFFLKQCVPILILSCFSMIWSLCAGVDEIGRRKLDNYVRELEGVFPLKDTIYEYFVDSRSFSLSNWEEKLSDSWRFNS